MTRTQHGGFAEQSALRRGVILASWLSVVAVLDFAVIMIEALSVPGDSPLADVAVVELQLAIGRVALIGAAVMWVMVGLIATFRPRREKHTGQ